MSLLLASLFSKQASKPGSYSLDDVDATQKIDSVKKSRTWLFTYIALFTSLLAFFILIISLVELEGSTPKRNYQKLVHQLHLQFQYHQKQAGIPWLQVENTLTKGLRISLPADLINNESLFKSASAQINPRYLPYLKSMLEVFDAMEIPQLKQRYAKLIRGIESDGYELQFMLKIEGHTDSQPLAATARFKNNVELSTFRAYAMMEWMRIHSGLPKQQFAISGYGSFHPLVENTEDARNRRIEIYLVPQIRPIKASSTKLDEGAAL